MPYLNILLAVAAYVANTYYVQGFCQPVTWARWTLLLSTGAFLLWPWLPQKPPTIRYAALFLQGIGLVVCIYCGLFIALAPEYYLQSIVLSFLLFPLLLWVPLLFGYQLWRRMRTSPLPHARKAFALGAAALLPPLAWAELEYRELVAAAEQVTAHPVHESPRYLADMARVLPRTYVTERVLGRHFRYHTYPEFVYDGWRPPLHDPLVNAIVALHWHDPIYIPGNEERAALYQAVFPDRPVKAPCACARIRDAEEYFDWHPEWNVQPRPPRTTRAGLFGATY